MVKKRILKLEKHQASTEPLLKIKCHLSRMMGEKKINIADLARALDINRNTVTLLYYEKAKRIDLDVLEKLCDYFSCSVNDILEKQP